MTGRGQGGERGGVASLLLLPVVLAALAVLLVGVGLGGVLLAAGRAEDVADEAALAVVRATVIGLGRPCGAAEVVAAGATGEVTVLGCRVSGGRATVRVSVAVPTPMLRAAGVRSREASASAEVVWP